MEASQAMPGKNLSLAEKERGYELVAEQLMFL
jgi:hypothetical protein